MGLPGLLKGQGPLTQGCYNLAAVLGFYRTLDAGDNWANRHVFSVVVKILHMEAWNLYYKMETTTQLAYERLFTRVYVCIYMLERVLVFKSTSACLLV